MESVKDILREGPGKYLSHLNVCLEVIQNESCSLLDDILKVCHKTMIETPVGDLYQINIQTARGIKCNTLVNVGFHGYKADIVIKVFAIDDPSTLSYIINEEIPGFYDGAPVLLVGVNANLNSRFRPDLFPLSLGPLLADSIGAISYVECTNSYKIFEEAVHAASAANDFELFDKEMVILTYPSHIGSQWYSVIEEANIAKTYPTFRSQLKDGLNLIGEQAQKLSHLDSRAFSIIQGLELQRVKLSHRQLQCHRNVYYFRPNCCLWYESDQILNYCLIRYPELCLSSCTESLTVALIKNTPVNLRFFRQTCESIIHYFTKFRSVCIRSLVIVKCTGVLNFSFLARLKDLKYLVIVNTEVDITSLSIPLPLYDTITHLVLNNCEINEEMEVPSLIGKLKNLELFNAANNNFKKLPKTMGSLKKLQTLILDNDKMQFPPAQVMRKPAQEVISFLGATMEDEVENKEAKLIVAGQEGVGKSTLIKAMKRNVWFTRTKPPNKTDGIDISVLPLAGVRCKVYDLAGDVEYLNTHSLFLSSKCLHLVVIDLSQFIVSVETRSADNLCRLELWLQTIASQDPTSDVIIVGTHADHPLISKDILQKHRELLVQLLAKYRSSHLVSQNHLNQECMLCNPDKVSGELKCFWQPADAPKSINCIPHIIGYFEVSGMTKYPYSPISMSNPNLKLLKYSIAGSIVNNMKVTSTETIPRKWISIRENIERMLSSDLQQQPLMPLTMVHDLAEECNIFDKSKVVAMLRFFHCQGTFLWYEDLPEMKEVIVIKPQWLSDQLRTIISHRSSVRNFIRDGVINLVDLPTLWANVSEENRSKLLSLFRSVGLCFSISETEELFPCNLPFGWPNEDMWSPLPNPSERQVSLLFSFSFVPPSFFPDLIVEVNKKCHSFARNVQPLYYRFHIVYITKAQDFSATSEVDNSSEIDAVLHRIHYELTPHNNSLKVAVRGPRPRSILHDVRSTIETVKDRRYPGITYTEHLLCPECEIKKVRHPATFAENIHDGVCSRGHEVGNFENILNGKLSSYAIVPSAVHRTRRVVGETLQDHVCPKLFVVLPINLESVSWKDRFVFSYLRDGYAVHLLCEFPNQWHFVDSPGFRVGKPKEFFEKYGSRVCKILQVISTLCIPFKAVSGLEPHCKIGAAVGVGATNASKELQFLLESYQRRYPYLHSSSGSTEDDLKYLKSSSGLQRSELSRFLEVEAKGHNFGPLVCTYVEKYDEWLWLCEEHSERFKIIERD